MVSTPVPSLLLQSWGSCKPGVFPSAAEDMRACWWQHTQAGPTDEDLGLWGCLHQPEEGRGAAPKGYRLGLSLKGQCKPRVNENAQNGTWFIPNEVSHRAGQRQSQDAPGLGFDI